MDTAYGGRVAEAIVLKNVSKNFNPQLNSTYAVKPLTLSINPGHVFALLGPNGAGKTTLLKMICGLIKPTTGTIVLNGYDVSKDRYQAMRQIGVVLEGARNIYWQLSTLENLLYAGRLKGYSGHQLQQRATKLLEDFELWDSRHSLVGDFSRGIQQKIAIACALVANPSIILFDEPTLGLDIQSARTIKNWIAQLAQLEGKTIIFTTHQLDIAQQLCQSLAIIKKGTLIAHETLGNLLELYKKNSYHFTFNTQMNDEQINHLSPLKLIKNEVTTEMLGIFETKHQLHQVLHNIHKYDHEILSLNKIKNLEEIFVHLMNQQ